MDEFISIFSSDLILAQCIGEAPWKLLAPARLWWLIIGPVRPGPSVAGGTQDLHVEVALPDLVQVLLLGFFGEQVMLAALHEDVDLFELQAVTFLFAQGLEGVTYGSFSRCTREEISDSKGRLSVHCSGSHREP